MASNQKRSIYIFEGRNYPVCIHEDDSGCLSQVKGSILKCPVCPNVNNFKDLSHLVTHYGSRDHLKSANETKIRHDLGNSQSIRVWQLYKLWESNNQVWRLLLESHQRKQKKTNRTQSESVLNEISSHVEDESDISKVNSKSESRASSEQASVIPSVETSLTAPTKRGRGRPRKNQTNNSENMTQDVTQTVLPGVKDEDTLQNSLDDYPIDPEAPKAKAVRARRKRDANNMDDDDVDTTGHAPVLKGKHYPGMNVFDFGHEFTPPEGFPNQSQQNDITSLNMQPAPTLHGSLNTCHTLQNGDTFGNVYRGVAPYHESYHLNGEQTLDQELGIRGKNIRVFKDTKKLKSDFKTDQNDDTIMSQPPTPSHSACGKSSPITRFVMTDDADKENVFVEELEARESSKGELTNESQSLVQILGDQGRGFSFRGWQGPL